MRLRVGERLNVPQARSPAEGYLVTGVVRETAWFGLYTGRRVFANYDFSLNQLKETDEQEWLEVLLRTVRYPHPDDAEDTGLRRRFLRQEVQHVLARRTSDLWPQPVDLLEVPSLQGGEPDPVLVLARPHGLPLPEWLPLHPLPAATRFHVLAELLVFLESVHAAGWVLQGLGPASILVDTVGHVHFLGTDLVTPAASSSTQLLDRARISAPVWQRLFPTERFPRGYGAPELFRADGVSDYRTDLYSWACLAMQLLAGLEPWKIAWEQGKPWAHFSPSHFTRLEKSLRDTPRVLVEHWGRQLGLAAAFHAGWPQTLVQGLAAALHPEPQRRPASVAQLREWLADPPPSAPAALLPLFIGQGQARLFLDLSGVDPQAEMEIRRQVGQPCLDPATGALLVSGPVRPLVDDPEAPLTPDPVFYSVFTRRLGSTRVSAAAWGETLQPLPSLLVALAEEDAEKAPQAEMPARVALFFSALDNLRMAQALLGSGLPPVRRWALERLSLIAQDPARAAAVETMIWSALSDPESSVRLLAARLLLRRPKEDDALLQLAAALARAADAEPLDQLARLRTLIPEDQWRRVEDRLERERPGQCPECQLVLTPQQRPDHLRSVHGYLNVEGRLAPAGVALAWWWDEVLLRGSKGAHDRIVENCWPTDGPGGEQRYLDSLAEAWERHPQLDPELNATDSASSGEVSPSGWRAVLLGWDRLPEILPAMLREDRATIHALGRQLGLAHLSRRFGGREADPRHLQQEMQRLCPGPELVEESIYLCNRLSDLGVDPDTSVHLLAHLRDQRLLNCPECPARVRVGDLEMHLRRAHRILQFRGRRGSFQEVSKVMVDALCQGNADPRAWKALMSMAQDENGKAVMERVLAWICKRLARWPRAQRQQAMVGAAQTLVQAEAATLALPLLVGPLGEDGLERGAKHLALELVAQMPSPWPAALVEPLLPLLGARALSRAARQAAVAAMVRGTGLQSPRAFTILQAYVAQSGKLRAVAKLDELEQVLGPWDALTELRQRLADQVRLSCPRCATQLRRQDMVDHLWQRHRLVLDGWQVREPWRLIEDWLVDYVLEKDPDLLERCQALAHRLDPEGGLLQLQRLMLRRGLSDPRAEESLRRHARRHHASLCPDCFGLVRMPLRATPRELTLTDNVLEGDGFRVATWVGNFLPGLAVTTPAGQLYHGRQPGRGLTRRGAWFLLVLPLSIGAFLAAHFFTAGNLPDYLPLALGLGLGLFLTGLLLSFSSPTSGNNRLVNLAWNHLIPHLLDQSLHGPPRDFVIGLLHLSSRHGDPAERADVLADCRDAAEELIVKDPSALPLLAACWSLSALDAQELGQDGLALMVEQIERTLRGSLPLAYAELLLGEAERSRPEWLSLADVQCRLRELLWLRARALGLEPVELVDFVRAAPALQPILDLEVAAPRRGRFNHSESARKVRRTSAQTCPECGAGLLACLGDIGVLVEKERIAK